MELFKVIGGNNVIIFLLLFSRVSAMMALFPFFSFNSIPISIKATFALFLTFVLMPFSHLGAIHLDIYSLTLSILSEFLLGIISGAILNIIFGALGLAGEQISFVMGFSMASTLDPITGVNSPVIGRFLTLFAILLLLGFNGHHLILLFLTKTFGNIELGIFYPTMSLWHYIVKAVSDMFMLGFSISFPIIALSLLSDLIFGMLMKTMPQFNLLVVGFPIKIIISFAILVAIIGTIAFTFKNEFLTAFNALMRLF